MKFSLDYSGLKTRIDQEDGECGQLYLLFKVETMLSSYLDWDEIKLTSEIGRGGYGVVYGCKWRNTSEYAVITKVILTTSGQNTECIYRR